jgi:CRP-like cAMP-binding protein
MRLESIGERSNAAQAHPLAELLACPTETGTLLNGSAQSLDFAEGESVFRQSALCRGLYVIVSGEFLRKAERLHSRLTLGPAHTGDLVELAAVLGDGHHTYSLAAQSAGSALLLPMETLQRAFLSYPHLRMQLLEELAREVSRAYSFCCLHRVLKTRQKSAAAQEGI